MDVYFSNFFHVDMDVLEEYGAFNVSLINDLPLFIDPFLLFNSRKPEYRELHENIIRYLRFLKDKSSGSKIGRGLLHSWFMFPEVEQNWLGFSRVGNKGSGLGNDFAVALHKNLHTIFSDFGGETVTKGSHLEKLCLIKDGVGRDNISDFTTNLVKEYLLTYTETFARKYIHWRRLRDITVGKVRFNYATETWESCSYRLPFYRGDFVLLTPKDLLTKDDIWINKSDFYYDFDQIPDAIPNENLRAQINNYFYSVLKENANKEETQKAIDQVIRKFPEILDYYVKYKEDNGNRAVKLSSKKVLDSQRLYVDQIGELVEILQAKSGFYRNRGHTYAEAYKRILFPKDVIENKGGSECVNRFETTRSGIY